MRTMPDAEYVVLAWLVAGDDPPDCGVFYTGAPPEVVVERIGGTADWLGVVDHPRLDITIWHTSKALAHDLAATVRQRMHGLSGQVVAGASCGGVTETLGLHYLPDEATEATPRYLFTVEITMRSTTATP